MALSDPQTIEAVWQKGSVIPDFSPTLWRRDKDGRAINRNEYGNRNSDYGWEIDHITPVSQGGTDALSNLRPLYWKTNVRRPT